MLFHLLLQFMFPSKSCVDKDPVTSQHLHIHVHVYTCTCPCLFTVPTSISQVVLNDVQHASHLGEQENPVPSGEDTVMKYRYMYCTCTLQCFHLEKLCRRANHEIPFFFFFGGGTRFILYIIIMLRHDSQPDLL